MVSDGRWQVIEKPQNFLLKYIKLSILKKNFQKLLS